MVYWIRKNYLTTVDELTKANKRLKLNLFLGSFYLESFYFPERTENVFCTCRAEKQKLDVYWKFCTAFYTFPCVYIAVHVPRPTHISDHSKFRIGFVNFSCKISKPGHVCVCCFAVASSV